MISGDSIIMPIAISTLDTTRSMIRNGMKIMKPIWNAVFSSDVTKAGTRMVSGVARAADVGALGQADEQLQVGGASLRQHERLQRYLGLCRASWAGICSFR